MLPSLWTEGNWKKKYLLISPIRECGNEKVGREQRWLHEGNKL